MAYSYNFLRHYQTSEDIKCLLQKKIATLNPYVEASQPENNYKINDYLIRKISAITLVKSVLIVILFIILYLIFLFNIRPKEKDKKYSFVFSLTNDQVFTTGSLESLERFFNSTRFPINLDTEFWIEIKKLTYRRKFKNFQTTIDVPLKIYCHLFGFRGKFKVFTKIVNRCFNSVFLLVQNKSAFLILKEYVFDEVIYNELDFRLVKNLITTQSHLMYQPLIFQKKDPSFERIMIWYSANSVPITYADPEISRITLKPEIFSRIDIDEHWVWTKEHAEFLNRVSGQRALTKGSMMFYNASFDKSVDKNIDVLVFDVTPVKDFAQNNIYNEFEVSNFILDIVDAASAISQDTGVKLRVCVKPKRATTSIHSAAYLRMLKDLKSSGLIDVLSPNQNLYDLISSARVVIGYPFTSPVWIGLELDIPSIFYSSSSLIERNFKRINQNFIQNRNELEIFICKNVMR
jgi:polysaccharide biosynthesis PFTS motif protein